MIKVVIVEDEVNARKALEKLLGLVDQSIKIVGTATHVQDAIDKIRALQPNIVFLDVQLEDGTGFDVLKAFPSIGFKIIFTTAYSQYAINAFKFSAIDYLLKPIDPTELDGAINRAKELIINEKEHLELLEVLKANLEKKEPKIVLKTAEQRYIIQIKDIIHLKADGAYTKFITESMRLIVSKNIKYYQSLLDENFVRCHQSHLVNTKHVKSISGGFLNMSNGDLVPISTRKRSAIIELLG